jgi:hypothetical protein
MPMQTSCSTPATSRPPFTSDLSLSDQRVQLMTLIADFSDRLRRFEDGPEKRVVFARLILLQQDLLRVQDALKGPQDYAA